MGNNIHALRCDRGVEVTDGPHLVVSDAPENRLHTSKALMALTMGCRP